MPDFIHKQPGRSSQSRDDGMYEDEPNSLVTRSGGLDARNASSSAGNTIGNIDNLLDGSSDGSPVSGAELNGMEHGSAEDQSTGGFYHPESESSAASATQLNTTESTGGSAAGFYTGDERRGGLMRGRFKLSMSRRKGVAGGIVGLLLGGGIFFGIGIGSGPLQVIHLGQILQHSFAKNNSDSSSRLGHLFRYARASTSGDIGETRVGVLGSRVFGKTVDQLKAIGIEIERGPTGAPTKTKINTEKLRANFPELDGMDDSAKKAFIADRLGVTANDVLGSGNHFSVDQKSFNMKAAEFSTKGTLGLLDDGKIVTGIKTRVFTKFFNLPSLFHPLKRALASKSNSASSARQQALEEQQAEEERRAALTEPTEQLADPAVSDAESGKGIKGGVVKAMNFTAGACFARKISGDIVEIDRYRVVLPAAIMATNMVALGSQVMSSDDLSADEVGAVVKSFEGPQGQSIWQGKALQELAGGNTSGLQDITLDQKQAFSSHKTANAIRTWSDDALASSVVPAGFTCNGITQIFLGLAQAATTVIGEVASAGTLTPAFAAEFTINTTASVAATAVAMHYIDKFIINKTTAKELAKYAFSGPGGGDLLAYGSRAAADITGIVGGISIGNTASTLFAENEQRNDAKQFESESFFARMFNASDYRSFMGRLADSINPSLSQDMFSFMGSFSQLGSLITGSFSSLLPSAAADNQPYDWGFPQYGLPSSMLNSAALSDPYTNASDVAAILDSSQGTNYIAKAQKCFGVSINRDSTGVWDVTPQEAVDPNSDTYVNAHCDDIGSSWDSATTDQQNWQRITMFVFDTGTMKAAACYGGDDQSCADEGLGSSGATDSTSGPTGSPVTTSGTSAELAASLLREWGKNLTGNAAVKQDLTATSQGKTITNSDTCGNTVSIDADLLQVLLTTTSKYKLFLDNIITGHGCDQYLHPKGRASDIGGATDLATGKSTNFTPGTSGDNQALDRQFYLYLASILPNGGEMGQDECAGRTGLTAPPGITFFDDTCTHQHVDMGNP